MSTPRTAKILITNKTDGVAKISLWHSNDAYGEESAVWTDVGPGKTVGPLTVRFNTGADSWFEFDYWACEISVTGGKTPGLYESSGVMHYSNWKENQLQGSDAGREHVFTVDSRSFAVNLRSAAESTPMHKVEQKSAQVYVTNNTDGDATITLFHNNSTDGTQHGAWAAKPGEKVGPLTVYFRIGLRVAFVLDWWAIKLVVANKSSAGVYQSMGSAISPNWKECQLQAEDVGKSMTFVVDSHDFHIKVPSGEERTGMRKMGPYRKIDNVFVLMLENHSFDNVFAFSGIPGIKAATTSDGNGYLGEKYPVAHPAPQSTTTDPGHEFADVVEQLCGEKKVHTPWQPYNQPIDNSGFVANYATTETEFTKNNPNKPLPQHWGDVMKCFDTASQLPVIYQLATTFAVCDAWHSSIPGPTWPNRFFVHGASSGGWADSPETAQIIAWESPGLGFIYPSGASIFEKLNEAGQRWRVYVDPNGPEFGSIPQAAALRGIVYKVNTNNFADLAADLHGPYPYAYTFIEPNYGDVLGGSYVGGSSQHPNDGMARGEALIKATYEAIRNSPVWDRSLLIVTYDEHGGFYDSVAPGPATPPGDGSPLKTAFNKSGFLFDRLGVRVPAVVVSPLVPKGSVDHTPYDHASVPKTLETLFELTAMTKRDETANDVLHLLTEAQPRPDCPKTLDNPVADAERPPAPLAETVRAQGAAPLPLTGNAQGFLQILAKTDMELARGDMEECEAIRARVAAITTVGEAEAYAREVTDRARLARAGRDAALAPPATPTRATVV